MKNLLHAIVITTFLTFATPIYSLQKNFEIRFPFKEDGRAWKKGYDGEDQLIKLTEYVLDCETKDAWSELVTTQYFIARVDFCLETFFRNAIKDIAKNNPSSKIDSCINYCDQETLFGEWWIRERGNNNQHEWVKIFKKKSAVGILRYTTKRMNAVSTRGEVWKDILDQAVFVQ
jgi:hypothetical protein